MSVSASCEQVGRCEGGVDVEGHQAFAALLVGNAGDDARGIAEDSENGLFDFEVRHHFAADFAEAREAVGDA